MPTRSDQQSNHQNNTPGTVNKKLAKPCGGK